MIRFPDGRGAQASARHHGGDPCVIAHAKPHCTNFFLHKFRHTFATEHLRDGVDICTLQRWMGHRDIQSTMAYLRGLVTQQAVAKVSTGWLSAHMVLT